MKRLLTSIILIILVLTITAFFLVQSGVSGNPHQNGEGPAVNVANQQSDKNPPGQDNYSVRATATYGAEQFYLQLTAIAGDDH